MRARSSLLAALVALLAGCPGGAPAPVTPQEPAPESIRWELERVYGQGGPVEFVVRLERTELDLSEELRIEEELRVAPGFVAEFPDILPEDMEGLGLVRIRDLPSEQVRGKTILRRRLLVEPEKTGACALEERWAFFHEEGQDAAAEKSLASDRMQVTVAEVPPGRDLELPAAPSIYTVDPSPKAAAGWGWLAALLLPLALFVVVRALRRARASPPPLPAHVVAADALARLDGLDLLAQGDVEGYFVYLSAILREYVERRYRVRAPEQTTQEFLGQAQGHSDLRPHAPLLREFLSTADGVKFALERPPLESARDARATVERLIEATQLGQPAEVAA